MRRLLIFVLLLFCYSLQAESGDVYIGFNEAKIQLPSSKVLLSQVIYIQSVNSNFFETEKNLAIELPVSAGIVESETILEFLKQQPAFRDFNLVWRGSSSTSLSMTNTTESNAKINEYAKSYLTEYLLKNYKQVEVNENQSIKDSRQIPDFDELRIKKNQPYRVNKRMAVWVELVVENKVIMEVPAWFDVKVFNYALVVNQKISTDTRIDSSMVDLILRDVTGKSEILYSKLPEFENYWTTRTVKNGEMITKSNIEREPDVKKNQVVVVEYTKKNIAIIIRGKALKQGFIGDEILIDIQEANRPVSAVVMAVNKVKVVATDV